jgi:hypothetical protein
MNPLILHTSNAIYSLGITQNAILYYKYHITERNALEKLIAENSSYKEFSEIYNGYEIQWKIENITENQEVWNVKVNVYAYESEIDTFYTEIYKSPQNLADHMYNGSGNDLYFLPIDIETYLLQLKECVNSNDTEIGAYQLKFFDESGFYNDTLIYHYNSKGILKQLKILYKNKVVFIFGLYNPNNNFTEIVLFSLLLISISVIILSYIIYKKKIRDEKLAKKKKKLLKKIK